MPIGHDESRQDLISKIQFSAFVITLPRTEGRHLFPFLHLQVILTGAGLDICMYEAYDFLDLDQGISSKYLRMWMGRGSKFGTPVQKSVEDEEDILFALGGCPK